MRRVVSTETVSATCTLSLSISDSEPIFAHLVHLQHISQVYWKVDPVQQNVSGIIFIHQDVWDFPSKCQTQNSQFPSKSPSSITTITFAVLGKPSKKPRVFYGQADRKGRGVTAPSLTVSKCDNFDLFPLEYDSLMHKTHIISLWGGWKKQFSCPVIVTNWNYVLLRPLIWLISTP